MEYNKGKQRTKNKELKKTSCINCRKEERNAARLKMRFSSGPWLFILLYQLDQPLHAPLMASSAGSRRRSGLSRTAAARTTAGRRPSKGAGCSWGSRLGLGSGRGSRRGPGSGTAARRGSARRGRAPGSRARSGSRLARSSGRRRRSRRTGGRRTTSSVAASGSRRGATSRGRAGSRRWGSGMRRGVRARSTCRRSPSSSIRSPGSADTKR